MVDTGPQTLSYALAVVGLGHVVAPGTLLRTARWGYDLVLDVEFTPRAGAERRVRLVGLAFVAIGLVLGRRLDDGEWTRRPTRDRHR